MAYFTLNFHVNGRFTLNSLYMELILIFCVNFNEVMNHKNVNLILDPKLNGYTVMIIYKSMIFIVHGLLLEHVLSISFISLLDSIS